MRLAVTVVTLVLMLAGPGASAFAADATVAVVVRSQTFAPAEIRVKAGTPFILAITNQDRSSDRFESQSLKIEKLIPPGQTVRMRVPALARGVYPFTKGRIIAE